MSLATSELRVTAAPARDAERLEGAVQKGERRLKPHLWDADFLVLRRRREIFRRWLAETGGDALSVLDVGGRIQPYRALLGGRARQYFAVDLRRTPLVSVVARGEQLPLAADSFDLVFCTQVLEYIAAPETVMGEIYRVLKPGGTLLLSVPALSPADAEEECWRFFPASLRHLLGSFSRIEIVPEGGSITGLCRIVNSGLSTLARYSVLRRVLAGTVFPVVNVLGLALERVAHSENQQFTANYSVRAQK